VKVILPFGDFIISVPVYSLSPTSPTPAFGAKLSTSLVIISTLITFSSPPAKSKFGMFANPLALFPSNLNDIVALSLVKFLI
jgi:hypothetical protein